MTGAVFDTQSWVLARPLWVDRGVHRAECARFLSYVVNGPGERDCAIWTGGIGADGYGFFVTREGHGFCVRPNRYALAMASVVPLGEEVLALHECDNPFLRESVPTGGVVSARGGGHPAGQHDAYGAGPTRRRPADDRDARNRPCGAAGPVGRSARCGAQRVGFRGRRERTSWQPAATVLTLRERRG